MVIHSCFYMDFKFDVTNGPKGQNDMIKKLKTKSLSKI